MIQNLHLLRCYRSCLVANKLHEAKRTNIRNYTRRNYSAKLHQTTMNNTVKYMLRCATLRNDTKKAHKILPQLALLHKNNKQTKKDVGRCNLHYLEDSSRAETQSPLLDHALFLAM